MKWHVDKNSKLLNCTPTLVQEYHLQGTGLKAQSYLDTPTLVSLLNPKSSQRGE